MIHPIGHFRVWRALYTKPIWLNSRLEQQVILMTLMAMANFKSNEWEWKGDKYSLKPGQFITSLESIRLNTGGTVSIQNIRTALKRFEKLGFLTNESTKEGRLVTLVNWQDYQYTEGESNKGTNKGLTDDQQRGNKDLTPIEEGKKVEKVKEGNNPISKYLNVLQTIENYPYDEIGDTEYYKILEDRFPTLDLVKIIQDFSIYKLGKGKEFKENSNHKLQISNWCKNDAEVYKKNLKPTEKKEFVEENYFSRRS